jgi:DNA polymerase III sliding clamp (beta) subunit (PCNA family)
MKNHSKLLIKALEPYKYIVPKRSSIPITESVNFTDRGIQGTDLSNFLFTPFPNLPSGICVPYIQLMEALKSIPGIFDWEVITQEFQPEPEPDQEPQPVRIVPVLFVLNYGSSQIKIPCESNEMFPICLEKVFDYKVNVPDLTSLLPFASDDELKPSMNGIFISPSGICATDAHSLKTFSGLQNCHPDFTGAIIPSNVIRFFDKIRVCEFNGDNGKVYLENKSELTFRIISDRYPDFKNVIPKENPIQVKVNRLELINILTIAQKSANKICPLIRLNICNTEIKILAQEVDFNNEFRGSIPCESNGEIEIGLNAKFILRTLKDIQDNEICIELSAPNRAIVIQSGDALYLNMPVMIKELQEA